jgi:Family of unknown function (DUF5670)
MGTLASILWFIVVVVVALWLVGFIFHVAGSFIHFLLLVAVVNILYNLFFASRTTRL